MKTSIASALLFLAVTAMPGIASAERMVTEVINVGFRPMAEILPLIKPLVPPPGTVSGIYDKLVIKTTAENLAEIKRVLAELDRPPRSLMITVRHDVSGQLSRSEAEAFGRVQSGDVTVSAGRPGRNRRGLTISGGEGPNRAGVRVLSTRSDIQEGDVQRIRVLEGREAFIRTGQSVPVAQRNVVVTGAGATVHNTIDYKDVSTGFYVIPRLNGDRVMLDIAPKRARLSRRGGGAIDIQESATSVSARLGEWVEIGSVDQRGNITRGSVARYGTSRRSTDHSIYLRVDEVGS
jgi:hypothetical protein